MTITLRHTAGTAFACLLSLIANRLMAATGVILIDQGQARAAIVLSAEPSGDEQLAADELRDHLRLMSGVDIPVVTVPGDAPAGGGLIFLGAAADAELEKAIQREGSDPASFALRAAGQRIDIRGLSPQGTLIGAYELLEQLGVRWFMPGDLGRVVPRDQDSVALPEQLTVQTPSFPARWLHSTAMKQPAWQRRMRMGGFSVPPSHGGVPRDVTDPKAIQGIADGIVKSIRGKELTTPHVVGLGPPDRPRWFSDNAAGNALDANDYDPFFGGMSRTDRLMWFYSRILEQVDEQIPNANVRIVFYAYHDYLRPPVRKDEVDPRIVPAFAPITLCRVHGMGENICPEKEYFREIVKGWHQAVPEIYLRGYYFNLAGPGVMFSMVHRLRREIPIAHELGVAGFRQEVIPKWGSETPSLYIASRLMWDHTADVDALLADFHEKFFGPAASPMGRYLDLMDAALRDADYHTGSAWDVLHWYPAELRTRARALLDEAREQAQDGIYAERIRAFRGTFDFTEAMIDMLEHRAAHRYVEANDDLERMRGLIAEFGAMEPQILSRRYSPSYLDRFFAPATEQAYARVTGGNEFVAGLKNEWLFRIDPDDIGEEQGYFRVDYEIPDAGIAGEVGYIQPDPLELAKAGKGAMGDVGLRTDKSWQRVRTATLSWSNLGLRYYKERPAWYRQSIRLPADIAGRTIHLWFGGIDDWAKIWVNGQAVGTGSGAFKPFEFDVTDVVRPGEDNVVAVKVIDRRLDELGTGGILAPVMVYLREPQK